MRLKDFNLLTSASTKFIYDEEIFYRSDGLNYRGHLVFGNSQKLCTI
jgi:hypothetical protein